MAEDGFGEAGLNGDEGAVVDVAPGEVAAANEEVQLIAKVAVADVGLIEIDGEMEDESE